MDNTFPVCDGDTVHVESVDELWEAVWRAPKVQLTLENGVVIARHLDDGTFVMDAMQLFANVSYDLPSAKGWVDDRLDQMKAAGPLPGG